MNLLAGFEFEMPFPVITDPDGDLYSIEVELGSASAFAKSSGSSIIFSPSEKNAGTFSIKVTLKDFNQTPFSQDYKFSVTVITVGGD